MNNNSIAGKYALVTGASRGIGQQICLGLAEKGVNLVLHASQKTNLEKTIELLSDYKIKVLSVEAELANPFSVDKMIETIIQEINGVDILYNNAAIMSKWLNINEVDLENWQKVFQINLFSVVKFCGAFVPIMAKRGWGRIINLTSGIKDEPNLAAYGSVKAALDKYTLELAFAYKNTGVLINLLDPGWLRTDLGGAQAPNAVYSVLPGALTPALLKDGSITGKLFRAQELNGLPHNLV